MMFHIHVYKVDGVFEVNVDSPDMRAAQKAAIKLTKKQGAKFKETDCNTIAIGYRESPIGAAIEVIKE